MCLELCPTALKICDSGMNLATLRLTVAALNLSTKYDYSLDCLIFMRIRAICIPAQLLRIATVFDVGRAQNGAQFIGVHPFSETVFDGHTCRSLSFLPVS